jgi:hypothetical protein
MQPTFLNLRNTDGDPIIQIYLNPMTERNRREAQKEALSSTTKSNCRGSEGRVST